MALAAQPTYKISPSATKVQLPTNYIDLFDFSSVYDPETHDQLARIYGKQSVAGMLYMLGAESAMASDKYIWAEEGRLHTIYNDVARSGNVFTKINHNFRKNEQVHISDGSTKRQGIITAVDNDTFTVQPYKSAGFTGLATTALTVFVFGSEFRKGTYGMEGSLEKDVTILENKPFIQKDLYEVTGSDKTQISWIQVDGGWLWYLNSMKDTRRRWEDRMEMSLMMAEKSDTGSGANAAGYGGSEGLFEAIRTRGNVYQGIANTIPDWDTILKRFDAQGKIQDYMFYVDRDQSLAIDNMLGELNAGYDGGISYGLFDNDKDMVANLGFRGFVRGTYNFFKTDWKLLNDPTLLGGVAPGAGKVRGILIPVGTKEVYEGGSEGDKITTPFLEVKYRAAGDENRKSKTQILGGAIPNATSSRDAMEVHHLTERMLKVCGANNFMLFEGA